MTRGTVVAAIAAAVLIVAGIALIVAADDGGSDDDTPASAVGPVADAVEAGAPASAPFPALNETRIGVGGRTIDVVVADEFEERYQGLRRRRDLGPYDGMLFVFDATTSTGFTMSTVPVVLDIGFYDADGRVVDQLRMQPCPKVESQCPTYRASGAFRYALETLAGDLPPGNLGPPG